jgi:voltage-gated potassium channel
MFENVRLKVHDVLVETDDDETIDKIVAAGLILLIVLNVAAVVLETVDEYNLRYGHIFQAFEIFSVAIFSIEYLLRIWIAPLDERYAKPFWGRIKYALSPMALIDLLAILPAFVPLFMATDLRIIRALRILRIFRLLKMQRYVQSLNTLDEVLRSKKEELIVTTSMIAIMLIFAGSLMYLVENEAQPDKFPDIPSSLWWGIATLTTVGYGDVFPITPIGKLLGGAIAFLGIGIFALPTGILANGFAEQIKKKDPDDAPLECPHCGKLAEK